VNLIDFLLARRGAIANMCLGIVFAAVIAVEAWNLASERRAWWLDGATGITVCTLALARERGRMRAAVAGLAVAAAAALGAELAGLPGQPGAAAMLALLVLLAAAVRGLPVLPAAGVAAGGAVLAGIVLGLHPDLGVGAYGLWWTAAVVAGLLLRLLDGHRQAVLDEVRRTERLELARELHDVAAHHMTGVVLQTQAARIAARKQPTLPDDTALDEALADIESAGTGALASMRRVIGLLRDGGDAAGFSPGPEQLTDLIDRFSGRGILVRLQLPDGPADPSWPPEVTATVYRVVLEALTNVIRHAPLATQASVRLAHDRQAVTVEVADDAPAAGSHRFPGAGGYGLVSMRERVQALGGTLTAGPCPEGGWSVRATIPIGVALTGEARSRP
jgi:signal transduction histidine kinase